MKKYYSITWTMVTLLLFNATAAFSLSYGDVNNDNKINIIDALLVAQYSVGIEISNFDLTQADVNQDKHINIIDALFIARYYIKSAPSEGGPFKARIKALPPIIFAGDSITLDGRKSETLFTPVKKALWEFGDGNKAEGLLVKHQFQILGKCRIKLTVTDKKNNSSEAYRTVTVYPPKDPRISSPYHCDITEYQVSGLKKQLGMNVYFVKYRSSPENTSFRSEYYVSNTNTLTEFGIAFGSTGLKSGLVFGDAFYYSYVWGSGIQRTHIGRMTAEGSSVKITETSIFPFGEHDTQCLLQELYVMKCEKEALCVVSGRGKQFNSWQSECSLNWYIDTQDDSSLKIRDQEGKIIKTSTPNE